MLFNSISFFIFFPLVVLLYFCIPQRFRKYWLLLCSYYFYMCWNVKYSLLLFASTLITYLSGLALHALDKRQPSSLLIYKKICVSLSFISNLGILFFFKYFDFALEALGSLLGAAGIRLEAPAFDLLLPVGISFYIFQALSYTMDVYRKDIPAEKNFFTYALFVSFFPQLVAGPIERSKNLLSQITEVHTFDFNRMKSGLVLMLWGYFQKLVIADRIAIYVDTVYKDYGTYGGYYLIVAVILFSFQIYCDFAGYSTIAIGAARVMGFRLMENFRCPFLFQSTAQLWRGWHISLTSWFKDYLYIPLGGSRKGKLRKYLNIMIVFLVSGLWHGARWSYVVWGGLNGMFQVVGEITLPLRVKLLKLLHLHPENTGHKLLRVCITFGLFTFAMIFFRSPGTKDALLILDSIADASNPWILFDGSLFHAGLNALNFFILFLALLVLLAADICKYKGFSIQAFLNRQDPWFRFAVYLSGLAFVAVFGIWGSSYSEAAFIYFQF